METGEYCVTALESSEMLKIDGGDVIVGTFIFVCIAVIYLADL